MRNNVKLDIFVRKMFIYVINVSMRKFFDFFYKKIVWLSKNTKN